MQMRNMCLCCNCLQNVVKNVLSISSIRTLSTSNKMHHKIAVLGCSGGVGQQLSLLLKRNSNISNLALFDIKQAEGIVTDLSHVDTAPRVTGHDGFDSISDCLTNAEVVVVPAGVSQRQGMTREDSFMTNSSIVAELMKSCVKYCPSAFICIISNPINSIVPICCNIFKRCGVENTMKIFGITNLDVIRARTFLAIEKNININACQVPVVGGNTEKTMVPILSQAKPFISYQKSDEYFSMVEKIRQGWRDVYKAKRNEGSPTLSMAYAGSKFVASILDAVRGKTAVDEYAFVKSDITSASYFSSKILIGPEGVKKVYDIGQLSAYEQSLLEESLTDLKKDIEKGEAFSNHYHV